MVVWLLACSEQPNQPFEHAKPGGNPGSHQSLEGESQSLANNDQAVADLILALKETKMALKESEILLRDAMPGKDSDGPLKALERELQAAEGLLIEVRKTIEQGDYIKAKGQIHEIADRTNHVNQQIKQAIRKQGRAS
ncbi:MAG: hypothetical protein R3351_09640, partial [Nitrospirales bacterium]|nr:hypothetical protein [Nitrospirales bacterium]